MLMKNTICFILITLFSLSAHAIIDGTYQTSCLNYAKDQFFRSHITIKGQDFGSKFSLYGDSNCQNLDLVVDYSSEVNYPTALDKGPIDHKVKSALMIVFNDKLRDELNSGKLCGELQVRLGTPLSIAGLESCGPLKVPTRDSFLVDMYQLKNGNISFGAFPLLWVQQEEKRPVLPSSIIFRKK